MDSSQLMAQTTQLPTMEKLVELADTSRESFALQMRMAAAALVGQQVTWTDADGVDPHRHRLRRLLRRRRARPSRSATRTVALDAVSSVTARPPRPPRRPSTTGLT